MKTWHRLEFRVPSLAAELPLECNICGHRQKGLWFYPYRVFEVALVDLLEGPPGMGMLRAPAGYWEVCDYCASLVEARNVEAMVTNSMAKVPGVTRSLVEALYSGFLDSRTGPARYSETRLDPERKS